MKSASEYLVYLWRFFTFLDVRLVCLLLVAMGILYTEPTLMFHAHPMMGDDWVYWRMSDDLSYSEPPFNARILVPAIIHLIPINHVQAFFVVSTAALMLMLWVFYHFLRALRFTHFESLIGITLLGASPMFLYTERLYITPEAVFFLFFVTSFYAIAAKKDLLFILALAVGVFAKETMVFLIPMYWFMVWRAGEAFEKRHFMMATLLIGLLYLGFKCVVLNGAGYISWGLIRAVWNYDMGYNNLRYMTIPSATYFAMGLLWLPALASVHKPGNAFVRRSYVITPFLLFQLLIAVDVTRMMFLFFPIVVPLALTAFRDKRFLPALLFWSVLVQMVTYYRFEAVLWYWFEVNFTLASNFVFIAIVALLLLLYVYSKWCDSHRTRIEQRASAQHRKRP
jgi:hypothetical protein